MYACVVRISFEMSLFVESDHIWAECMRVHFDFVLVSCYRCFQRRMYVCVFRSSLRVAGIIEKHCVYRNGEGVVLQSSLLNILGLHIGNLDVILSHFGDCPFAFPRFSFIFTHISSLQYEYVLSSGYIFIYFSSHLFHFLCLSFLVVV